MTFDDLHIHFEHMVQTFVHFKKAFAVATLRGLLL
jgi:hypothetical protein